MLRTLFQPAAIVAACVALVAELHAASPARRWAVCIGVDQYDQLVNLEFAGDDQRALAAEFRRNGFADEQMSLLHDVAKQTGFLPFRENVERELDRVLDQVGPDDLFVFAFSGHGVQLNGKSYLCPTQTDLTRADETLVSLDVVFEKIEKCPAAVKLLFIDAAHDDPRPIGLREARDPAMSRGFSERLATPPAGSLLFASCSPGEVSREDERLRHGVFMHHVLEGLRGKAAAEGDAVTLTGLKEFVCTATEKYAAERWNIVQKPRVTGDFGAYFELARAIEPTPTVPAPVDLTDDEREKQRSPLTGTWNGRYFYTAANANGEPPVDFKLVLVQDGTELTGFIREKNTFQVSQGKGPWLHASFRGKYDAQTRHFSIIKTYDGTADVTHDVHYTGTLAEDGLLIKSGTWSIPGNWSGQFTLQKDPATHAGKWSGVWTGTKYFPEAQNAAPVKFSVMLVYSGNALEGLMKERRTFLDGTDPWYHAVVLGRLDDPAKKPSFSFKYDGSAEKSGTVRVVGGPLDDDPITIVGPWTSSEAGEEGRITLRKYAAIR